MLPDSEVLIAGEEWRMTELTDKLALTEMLEFMSFTSCEQRYICRSLDVAAGRHNAIRTWARSLAEARSIRDQARAYRQIDMLGSLLPDDFNPEAAKPLLASLIAVTTFDLAQGDLVSFPAYRFLYERMLGMDIQPWLVPAFCAAVTLPGVRGDLRVKLLKTLPETAAAAERWSTRKPTFMPQWVAETVPA